MQDDLTSAETQAEHATSFGSFTIHLRDTRRTVEQILSQFGKNGRVTVSVEDAKALRTAGFRELKQTNV
jgi:hypothetical protein